MLPAPQFGFRCHADACPLSLRAIALPSPGRCPLCGGPLRNLGPDRAACVERLPPVVALTEARLRRARIACQPYTEIRTRSLTALGLRLARLVIAGAEGRRRHHWIFTSPFRIGRGHGADLLLDHEMVSRIHAQVVEHGGVYMLEDLRSANGTFVNDERVKRRALRDRDEIRVGGTRMVFVSSS
jgi:hypothetical protein